MLRQEKLSILYLIDIGKWNRINGKAIVRKPNRFFFISGEKRGYNHRKARKKGADMINFNKTKTRKRIAAVIIFILIIAMVLPSILSAVV